MEAASGNGPRVYCCGGLAFGVLVCIMCCHIVHVVQVLQLSGGSSSGGLWVANHSRQMCGGGLGSNSIRVLCGGCGRWLLCWGSV